MSDGIVAAELRKVYSGGLAAVDGVSFEARPGEILGVLGPNGAGKSTTLNMVTTVLRPTAGTATVCGHDLAEVDHIRPLIGVALQDVGLDPLMNADEHMVVQSALYRMPEEAGAHRAGLLLEQFALAEAARRPVGTYSLGMQRRLALALAVLHDPRVLVFDEPTAGLDPRSRRAVWDLMRQFRDDGRTVVFSTQYLEEADDLCDHVLVIDGGVVVGRGTPGELKQAVSGSRLRLRFADGARAAEALALVTSNGATGSVDGTTVQLQVPMSGREVHTVLARLGEHLDPVEIVFTAAALDDVFLELTGRTFGVEPAAKPKLDMGVRMHRGGGKRWT